MPIRPDFLDEANFYESLLPFVGDCALPASTPVHCLAIRAYRRWDGEIDSRDLEDFLDSTAGPGQWLMTAVWMFARAPAGMRPAVVTVAVICLTDAAARLNLADCEDDRPQRVLGDHIVGEIELQGWHWVVAQVYPRADLKGIPLGRRAADRASAHA